MLVDWTHGLELVLVVLLAALGGLFALAALQARTNNARRTIFSEGSSFSESSGSTCFLFDGETLVDATPGARALLAASQTRGAPWARLLSYISPRFPEYESGFARLQNEGRVILTSIGKDGKSLILRAEVRGGLTRITLVNAADESRIPGFDPLTHRAMQDELDLLRTVATQAPCLIWREGSDGEVIWANATYLALAIERLEPGTDLTWPLPRLFERVAMSQGAAGQRQRLNQKAGSGQWFDIVGFAADGGRLLFGIPADAIVQAEGSLREFMQTLTKTFAHLPIGLAIFDRQRQLALFNPALMDLSGLQPDFLSLRPTLFSFLDAMRDRNMIPEPKDYRGWRKEMTELEKAASSGLYEETWSLPTGQTYKVTGRPHPNGALALMFEDISNEMSRTRRYHADMELGQAVVDAMEEALAVFSQSGILVMSNVAYAKLWGHDPATTVSEGGIGVICSFWRSNSAPSQLWSEVETFVATLEDRTAIGGEARLNDGRLVNCRFAPLPSGATLATFQLADLDEGSAPRFATGRLRKLA